MTSPVTSTSVATNGAEAEAGSTPTRCMIKGSMLPATEPNATTPVRLIQIVAAIRYG